MTALLAGGALFSVTHCDNDGEAGSGGGESTGARFPTSGSSGDAGQGGTSGIGGSNSGKGGGSCAPATTATTCLTLAELAECPGIGGSGLGGEGGNGGAAGNGAESGNGSAGESGEGGTAGEAASSAGAGAELVSSNPCPSVSEAYQCIAPQFVVSGPTWDGMKCCYTGATCKGLAFTVGHAARTAHGVQREDWSTVFGSGGGSEPASELADTLARGWLDDALAEHASIASFARLTLELLALGAPAALVARAQAAALDEIRHARLCFALSQHYSREAVGPSPLAVDGALPSVELERLAVRTVRDGCIGETVAALIVAEQAEGAVDPELARGLRGIADDEARHAELSWSLLGWLLDVGGSGVRIAVARTFETTLAQLSRGAAPAVEPSLRAHGRLNGAEIALVTARALSEVVAPCARALLANYTRHPLRVDRRFSWSPV